MKIPEPFSLAAAHLGLSVSAGPEGSVTVVHGRGPSARGCCVSLDAIANYDAATAAAFVRGLHAVLNEPVRSDASTWDFAEAAKYILPTIELPAWRDGVLAADGGEPFAMSFGGELRLHFILELDIGYHALGLAQVRRWGATDDRVERAAASMLFHRTRDVEPTLLADHVETLAVGDGFDAARALILDACNYSMCRAGIYFTVPTPEKVLFTRQRNADGMAALRAATADAHARSRLPLSQTVFEWEAGRRNLSPVG